MAFGLAVLAGLMAVVAAPAMATPRWVHCVHGTGAYTSGTCATLGAGGWETKELVGTSEVTTSGELTLEDEDAPGGAVTIVCTGRDLGWVANLSAGAGEGGIFAITSIACKFESSATHGECEESKGVTVNAEIFRGAASLRKEKVK